jgi:catechol 2,3-dioxygenase-like lactoylglutathione lyase family enzyme
MILAFAHPGIVVPNLEQAIDFYGKAFGFRLLSDQEGWENSPETDRAIGCPGSASRGAMLAGHNCYLELFEYSSPTQTADPPDAFLAHEPGIRHIAFYVDDVKKEFERFLSVGGKALGELVDGATAVYVRDPFGNIIELAEIPNPKDNPTELPGVAKLSDFGA